MRDLSTNVIPVSYFFVPPHLLIPHLLMQWAGSHMIQLENMEK